MKSLLLFLLLATPALAQLVNPSVSGPASSTNNAIPLWDGTAGNAIKDSKVLLDQTAMGTGTATFKPQTGSTARTYTFPDVSGVPLIKGVFETLDSTFIAESDQWFNNSDTSKRFVFSLTNIPTSTTITLSPPAETSTLVGAINNSSNAKKVKFDLTNVAANGTILLKPNGAGNGTNGTYNFPAVTSGGSVSLVQDNGPTITNIDLAGYSDYEDTVLTSEPAGNTLFDPYILRVYDYNNNLYARRGDSTRLPITEINQSEIDFGSSPLTEQSVAVTNSYLTALVKVTAEIGRLTATGKSYVDEMDMDSFSVGCTPGAGTMTCMVKCLTGQASGKFKLNYRIGG